MPALRPVLLSLLRVRPYEVELLRPKRPVTPLAWIAFASGLVTLAAAALVCKPVWERQVELGQRRGQLQTELARFGIVPSKPASNSRERPGTDEALALLAEMRRPWHELFDQIEAAQTQDVHLVQLSIDPRFASLQLVAEGRDLDKLVRFAQRLPGAGPIRTMSMTHQEWRDTLGAHVVSASMQGELAPVATLSVATGTAP